MTKDAGASAVTISDLYPSLSVEEQEEVVLNLARYLDVICRIHERHRLRKGLRTDKDQI